MVFYKVLKQRDGMSLKGVIFHAYTNIIKNLFGSGLSKYAFVRDLNNFLVSKIRPDFVEIQGNKMIVNSLDNLYLSFAGHEEFESQCVKKIIKKGDCVVDIGANQGYFTLFFANLVGENGRVISFEPDPKNCEILKRNIKMNGYKNIVLHQKAVANKTGKIKMYVGNYRTGNRIYDSSEANEIITIDAITFDDFLKEFDGIINFIKMDAEGSESGIIEGMKNYLEKTDNLIIMSEFFPELIEKYGRIPGSFLDMLTEEKFSVYEMDENKKEVKLVDKQKILSEYTIKKRNWANLLCFKGNSINEKDFE